jgi:hypothetical protein
MIPSEAAVGVDPVQNQSDDLEWNKDSRGEMIQMASSIQIEENNPSTAASPAGGPGGAEGMIPLEVAVGTEPVQNQSDDLELNKDGRKMIQTASSIQNEEKDPSTAAGPAGGLGGAEGMIPSEAAVGADPIQSNGKELNQTASSDPDRSNRKELNQTASSDPDDERPREEKGKTSSEDDDS